MTLIVGYASEASLRQELLREEDVNLKAKLEAELRGIAARCVRAYQRLCKRGYFVQPDSATELDREVLTASDPFTAMVQACFVPDPASTAKKSDVLLAAQKWLIDIDRPDIAARLRDNNIRARIMEVSGFENIGDAPRPHGGPRSFSGLRLRPQSERNPN